MNMLEKLLKMRDIRSLDRAVVLAEELNYQRAAHLLCITQSALSRSIANLEESLDITIFDRNQTGVRLTQSGKDFLFSAKRLLSQFDDFIDDLDKIKAGESGRTAFGVTPVLARLDNVKKTLVQFLSNNNNFDVVIEENSGDRLLGSLLKGDIEFYIAADRDVDLTANRLALQSLCVTEFVVAARKSHPLLQKDIIDGADISGYPVLAQRYPIANGYNSDATYGWRHEYNIKATMHCDDVDYMMSLAAETDCLVVIMKHLLSSKFNHNLVELPVGNLIRDWKYQNIVIVTLQKKEMSRMAKSIVDLLRSFSAKSGPLSLATPSAGRALTVGSGLPGPGSPHCSSEFLLSDLA